MCNNLDCIVTPFTPLTLEKEGWLETQWVAVLRFNTVNADVVYYQRSPFPKLDVAVSIPVFRSFVSVIYFFSKEFFTFQTILNDVAVMSSASKYFPGLPCALLNASGLRWHSGFEM